MELGKTVNDLFQTSQVLDADYMLIYKPNLFNVVKGRNGDTQKIALADLADFVIERQRKNFVGVGYALKFQPDPLWLAKNRLLVLNYQIIEIALYQELCDRMWVGAAANATALSWYKCNADGTRNVNGAYMRVEDSRGVFWRGAGANAVLRTDMNDPLSPPYDGKDIGDFGNDKIKAHRGVLITRSLTNNGNILWVYNAGNLLEQEEVTASESVAYTTPTQPLKGITISFGEGPETTPVWLPVWLVIRY